MTIDGSQHSRSGTIVGYLRWLPTVVRKEAVTSSSCAVRRPLPLIAARSVVDPRRLEDEDVDLRTLLHAEVGKE